MTSKTPHICVIGSINMDLTVETPIMPEQGETLIGKTFATYPGGKGANQAVAAARLGANVSMIGAVGADAFGETLLDHLKQEGVSTDGIATIPDTPTGIANIIVSDHDNRIIVIPGANKHVTPSLVDAHRDLILASDIILLQFEVPMETVAYAAKLAHEHGIKVIVNPAPFQPMSQALINDATYLTPNESEAKAMVDDTSHDMPWEKVILTMGAHGVQYTTENQLVHQIPPFTVDVVDTTGAGDTFNGAVAVKLSEGESITEAVAFASATAALSITKTGAQNGMPTKAAVESFIKNQITKYNAGDSAVPEEAITPFIKKIKS
ncbi:ribokinase [Lentibacillus saliphilus]|uniref:ribokinase n=1 Tax=Lentibacillus saliphilus TaxID=2737028 RepID=UPI001C307746|nr:ribokinase [Lentibacillus saliphilus]